MLPKQTQIATAANHATAASDTTAPSYFGQHKDGNFLIIKDGRRAKLSGVAFELVSYINGDGTSSKKRRKVGSTPGYVPGTAGEKSLVARCSETKKWYRLIGQLRYCSPKANAAKLEGETEVTIAPIVEAVVSAGVQHVLTPIAVVQPEAPALTVTVIQPLDVANIKKQQLAERQFRAFKRELEVIAAQRAVGIDPPVSIATACRMSRRSPATVYRDMGKKFLPRPDKNGRNSSLKYSVVEAYMAGHVVGGAA
jgi:hypothetical protein